MVQGLVPAQWAVFGEAEEMISDLIPALVFHAKEMDKAKFDHESAKLKAQMAERKAQRPEHKPPPERIKYMGYEYVRADRLRELG